MGIIVPNFPVSTPWKGPTPALRGLVKHGDPGQVDNGQRPKEFERAQEQKRQDRDNDCTHPDHNGSCLEASFERYTDRCKEGHLFLLFCRHDQHWLVSLLLFLLLLFRRGSGGDSGSHC